MAWEKDVMTLPAMTTVTDFSGTTGSTNGYNLTAQFLFVKVSADETVALAGLADAPVGVNQTNPKWASGQAAIAASIRSIGISKIVVGTGGVTFGQFVGPDANGAAVPRVLTTGGADAGRFVGGLVLKGGAAGELAVILLLQPWVIQA